MHYLLKVALESLIRAGVKQGVSAVVNHTTGRNTKKTVSTAATGRNNEVPIDSTAATEIKRKIDDVRSKLDAVAKINLLASISFFNEGDVYLSKVFEEMNPGRKLGAISSKSVAERGLTSNVSFSPSTAWREVLNLAKWLNDLEDSAKRALCEAKKRFKDARREATKAFWNESLNTNQRILAMRYRVAATILEKIDVPAEALPACKLCLEELHSLPAIQASLAQEESVILADIREVNSVVCDVTQIICGGGALLTWPCIVVGSNKVDPLHDRTTEHFCQTWSFGQQGEEEHKLKFAWSIASNSLGQFIVGDSVDRNIKVFDECGVFLHSLYPFAHEVRSEYEHEIWNIACDQQDNVFVLALKRNKDGEACLSEVFVLDNRGHLSRKFSLTQGFRGSSLTVDEFNRVMVAGGSLTNGCSDAVEVYQSDGEFLQSFGKEILHNVQDIAAAYDGHSLVLDTDEFSTSIRVFDAQGNHLNRFSVRGSIPDSGSAVVFHRGSENVLVASFQSEDRVEVSMYSKEFKFVRVIQFTSKGGPFITGITATVKGRIAVPCKNAVLLA